MKLSKVVLLFIFVSTLCGLKAHGQKSKKSNSTKSNVQVLTIEQKANTAVNETYLSDKEKEVVMLCNIARMDGNYFISNYLVKALKDTNTDAYRNIAKALRNQKSEQPLKPAFSLYKSALVHARDMGISGKTGHQSSCGQTASDRIQQYFPSTITCSENYYVGSGEPMDIVLSFLEGRNDPNLEYQKNILSADLYFIGVAIQPHKYYCNNAVMDFAQKPEQPLGYKAPTRKPVEIYWKDCPPALTKKSKRSKSLFNFASWFKKKS
jgi:uncharacterized protein YkwD